MKATIVAGMLIAGAVLTPTANAGIFSGSSSGSDSSSTNEVHESQTVPTVEIPGNGGNEIPAKPELKPEPMPKPKPEPESGPMRPKPEALMPGDIDPPKLEQFNPIFHNEDWRAPSAEEIEKYGVPEVPVPRDFTTITVHDPNGQPDGWIVQPLPNGMIEWRQIIEGGSIQELPPGKSPQYDGSYFERPSHGGSILIESGE